MLHDQLLQLQEKVTRGTALDSGGIDLRGGTGTPDSQALFAEVLYNMAYVASGTGTAVFKVQESDTLSGTYTDLTQQTVNLSNTTANAVSGILYLPVLPSKRFVRLSLTFTGTTPTITYSAYLVTGKPR